jgi:hypothetical protein
MSDRPQGSVRSGSRTGDGATGSGAPTDGAPADHGAPVAPGGAAEPQRAVQQAPGSTGTQAIPTTGTQAIPSTGTQAIPTTGTQRVAGGPAAGQPVGAPPAATRAPSGPPAGARSPAAAVPPPAAAVPPPVAAPSAAGAPRAGASGGPTVGATPAKGRMGRPAARGPRRARLQLRHIDTWSALKISLVLSIALFFIWMVAVGVLYGVLNALGVFDTLNELFGQLGTDTGSDTGNKVLTPGVVFGGAAIIGAINIVLLTALCTVGTFIYNMCSDLVGGLELTLSERD